MGAGAAAAAAVAVAVVAVVAVVAAVAAVAVAVVVVVVVVVVLAAVVVVGAAAAVWRMNCRKQYVSCPVGGKLAEVAVYSLVCSRCCRNKQTTANYRGNLLESRGTGAGSSPIGCEGFMKASKVQGSSLLLSNADNFVGYSYIYIYIYIFIHVYHGISHIYSWILVTPKG